MERYVYDLLDLIAKGVVSPESNIGRKVYEQLLLERGKGNQVMPKVCMSDRNTFKRDGVFNPAYRYNGKELAEVDDGKGVIKTKIFEEIKKPCAVIRWFDNTNTVAVLSDEDEFDAEFGILICFAKKFVKGFNLKKLYCQKKRVGKDKYEEVYADKETVKEAIKQILKALGNDGARMVKDAREFVEDWQKIYRKKQEKKNRKAKNKERKEKLIKKIEELKKQGKYISKKDKERIVAENKALKKKLEDKKNEVDYKELEEENKRMKKELGIKD